MTLLHALKDFGDLIAVTARDHAIDPGLVEKDYWIMHGLWGLQHLGFRFELKGGTSLSKGFRLIHRFSEDINVLIHPDVALPIGKNQNKSVHVEARRSFYDSLPPRLSIPGSQARNAITISTTNDYAALASGCSIPSSIRFQKVSRRESCLRQALTKSRPIAPV
jgi:Nucleotidyl transferase AbiEii toxin, Type IV TA system